MLADKREIGSKGFNGQRRDLGPFHGQNSMRSSGRELPPAGGHQGADAGGFGEFHAPGDGEGYCEGAIGVGKSAIGIGHHPLALRITARGSIHCGKLTLMCIKICLS